MNLVLLSMLLQDAVLGTSAFASFSKPEVPSIFRSSQWEQHCRVNYLKALNILQFAAAKTYRLCTFHMFGTRRLQGGL